MDPVVPVQNKNISGDPEEPYEVPGADEVIYTDNFSELAKLVKISPGIIVRRRHTDQKQMGLQKEQCAE